jgi:hypothetical protein
MAMFRGLSDMGLAFSMSWLAKKGDGRLRDRPSAGTSPDLAAQDRRTPVDASRPENPVHVEGPGHHLAGSYQRAMIEEVATGLRVRWVERQRGPADCLGTGDRGAA